MKTELSKQNRSIPLKAYVLLIATSLILGFTIAYATGAVKVYSVSTGTPDCLTCEVYENFDTYYGLPLQFLTTTYYPEKDVISYTYLAIDAIAWALLVFIIIYIPMLAIKRNRARKLFSNSS